MKKDNRGFLLAESLIVSTFVLTVLILLYIQFNNLTTNYQNSYDYNNVESIYDVASVADFLLENGYDLSTQLTSTKPYVVVFKDGYCNLETGISGTFCDTLLNQMGATTVIYTSSNISIIQEYVSSHDDSNINQSFREFISRVETTTILNKGRLFAEFENGTYATIAMDNEVYIEEESTTETVTIGDQTVEIVTTGDGLYKDEYESDKYDYKGANPNNYITFNGGTWRIVSVSSDGIKIISTASIGYAAWNDSGLSDWATATLNTYLNNTYLNNLSNENIISHTWNIGSITSSTELTQQITDETANTLDASVGLITVSEYIRANSNSECLSYSLNNTNLSTCTTTNWMIPTATMWTLSTGENGITIIESTGNISEDEVTSSNNAIYPVLYLKADITLSGSGTYEDPYTIN